MANTLLKESQELKTLKEAMFFLGIGPALTETICTHFNNNTEEISKILKENPYKLMAVDGISFRRADRIAANAGITDNEDPRRKRALVELMLEQNTNFGHTYLPLPLLQKSLKRERITDRSLILKLLDELVTENSIIIQNIDDVYLKKYYDAEVEVANNIKQRLKIINDSQISIKENPDLDIHQRKTLDCLHKNISIITGGPGTGKTYVTKLLCDILFSHNNRVALVAPTGKAARRLSQLTGRRAETIHAFLKASFGRWGYHKDHQKTNFDWIIVDESSMLDIELAWKLLQSLPLTTNFIFIGDVDQIPPVGPGTFFRDLIASKLIFTVRLKENHRQGPGSNIANVALAIQAGVNRLAFGDDIGWVKAESPVEIRAKLFEIIKDCQDIGLIKTKFDLYERIQTLTPQRTTLVGVDQLNELLRIAINPAGVKSKKKFTIGDKVMQLINDRKMDIYNGSIGVVEDETSKDLIIRFFDEGVKRYPKERMNELEYAWVSTIHKFQGSETPIGIIIVSSSHAYMLTRNLLYTAITRCKERCVLVGDATGLTHAVRNLKENRRYSKFFERICGDL